MPVPLKACWVCGFVQNSHTTHAKAISNASGRSSFGVMPFSLQESTLRAQHQAGVTRSTEAVLRCRSRCVDPYIQLTRYAMPACSGADLYT